MQCKPATNMFNAALATDADHEAARNDHTLIAAFIAIGASEKPLTSKDTDAWAGQCFFIEAATKFTFTIHAAMLDAIAKGKFFDGVFVYEVAEEFGRFFYNNQEADDAACHAEIERLCSKFFTDN